MCAAAGKLWTSRRIASHVLLDPTRTVPRMNRERSTARVLAILPQFLGWCTREKATGLVESVFELPAAPLCVEVGVFGGQSLCALAVACAGRGGHVWGIDAWRKEDALAHVAEPENRQWWSEVDYERVYSQCLRTLLDLELLASCTIVRSSSARAAALFDPESLDLLHIDGNHSEEESEADVLRWIPKLKLGGVLWFDDVDWQTTRRAQEQVRRFCDPEGQVGTCARYRRQRTWAEVGFQGSGRPA